MVNRYPSATWYPGNATKVWPDENVHDGIMMHSMEGTLGTALQMLANAAVQVSWHFSVAKDGTVYQHYDINQSPWHAGNHDNNKRFIGIEHAGVKGEPLTPGQLAASVALVTWLAQEFGWQEVKYGHGLFGHSDWFATSCPNDRIPWGSYEWHAASTYDQGYAAGRQATLQEFRDWLATK